VEVAAELHMTLPLWVQLMWQHGWKLQLSEYAESFTCHHIVRGRELLTLGRRDLKDTAVCRGPHHVIQMEAVCSGGQRSF
jgi:hypothetical protein